MRTSSNEGWVRRSVRHRVDVGWIALAVLLVLAAGLILYLGRHFTFYADEWFFVLYRDGNSAQNILAGHGGHLSIFPVLLYAGLFKTVGLGNYWVYRGVALLSVLVCATLVYVLARRRIGGVAALAPVALLLFLGSGADDLLRPFQIVFTAALTCGLVAILLLDRDDFLGDVGACLALLASIGWSGAAVPFIAAIAVGLVVKGRFWRRIWVPLLPALIYPVWAPRYSDVHTDYTANLSTAPSFAIRMVESAISGITGLPHALGVALMVVFAGVVVIRLWHDPRSDALPWEMLACGFTFWGITALSQAQENTPGVPRYLYVSSLFIVLLAVAIAPRRAPRVAVAMALLVVGALMLQSNIRDLVHGADPINRTSQYMRAELGAMQIAGGKVAPGYTLPLGDLGGVPVPAGPYFAVIGRLHSSPADAPDEIDGEPEFARRGADRVLAAATDLRLTRAAAAEQVRAHHCSALPTDGAGQTSVPRSGLLVRGSERGAAELLLRQYAHTFSVKLGQVAMSGTAILRPDVDSHATHDWILGAVGRVGPISVCRL